MTSALPQMTMFREQISVESFLLPYDMIVIYFMV